MARHPSYGRPLLLVIACVQVLGFLGWRLRYRVAVEVQLRACGHQASRNLHECLGTSANARLRSIVSSDADPTRRVNAMWRLAVARDSEAIPVLTDALWDSDPRVQQGAWTWMHLVAGRETDRWMRFLSDEQLVDLVRRLGPSWMRVGCFCRIARFRRSAMHSAGEALLASVPAPSSSDLVLCVWAVKVDPSAARNQQFALHVAVAPEDHDLLLRFARLGVQDPVPLTRYTCRSAVAEYDAKSLSEQEIVDWTLDLVSDKDHLDYSDVVALVAELGERKSTRFEELTRTLLSSARLIANVYDLCDLVCKYADPQHVREILRAAHQNPDSYVREAADSRLERLDFEDRMREFDQKLKGK